MPSITLSAKTDKLKISHNSGSHVDLPQGSTTTPYDALNAQHVLDVKFGAFANPAEGEVNQCNSASGIHKPCLSVKKKGLKTKKRFKAHPKTRKINESDSASFKGIISVRRTGNIIRYGFGEIDLKFNT